MSIPTPSSIIIRVAILIATAASIVACGGGNPVIVPITTTPTTIPPDATFDPTATPTPSPTPTIVVSVDPVDLPTPQPTDIPLPTATPEGVWLPGEIRIYPGPLHYEGDILSIEVFINNMGDLPPDRTATLSIDGQTIRSKPAPIHLSDGSGILLFRWAWDSSDQEGFHTLTARIPVNAGLSHDLTSTIQILPADERPRHDADATWASLELFCCVIDFIAGSAADRDQEMLEALFSESIASIEEELGFAIANKPLSFVLLDNIWGDGSYTRAQSVITLIDRDYSRRDLETRILHEATIQSARSINKRVPPALSEGLAVYIASHPETSPLPGQAAALNELGLYIPLENLMVNYHAQDQTIAEIEMGAYVAFLIDRYTREQFIFFYSRESDARRLDWFNESLDFVFDTTLERTEFEFNSWLSTQDSEPYLEELLITIDYDQSVRRYQEVYAPYQQQLPIISDAIVFNFTADFLREAMTLENITLEVMLIETRQALVEGRIVTAEELLTAINDTLTDGDFTRSPIADYLAIVTLLDSMGYEVQSITLAGGQAEVVVIRDYPTLESLSVIKTDAGWEIGQD